MLRFSRGKGKREGLAKERKEGGKESRFSDFSCA